MDRNKDDPALRAQCAGKWRKLVDEMLAYDGTASVFSMEFLSYASPDEAKRITKSLSKAEVHVVLTVRDATGAIPAQWQTFSRNGGVVSWPDFARGAVSVNGAPVRGELAQGARAFRRTQGSRRCSRCGASGFPRTGCTWSPSHAGRPTGSSCGAASPRWSAWTTPSSPSSPTAPTPPSARRPRT